MHNQSSVTVSIRLFTWLLALIAFHTGAHRMHVGTRQATARSGITKVNVYRTHETYKFNLVHGSDNVDCSMFFTKSFSVVSKRNSF